MRAGLALVAAALSAWGLVGNASAADLQWSTCWWQASSGYRDDLCQVTAVNVPVCYPDAPCEKGANMTHSLQVFRRVVSADPTIPTLFVVYGSLDYDQAIALMARYVKRSDTDLAANVYVLESRLWAPPLGDLGSSGSDSETTTAACDSLVSGYTNRVTIDSFTLDAAQNCTNWLSEQLGVNATNAFTLDAAAKDLAYTISQVQKRDLAFNPNVYVVASSKATRVVQRFIAMDNKPSPALAGYVFDTPSPMKYTVSEDRITGVSSTRFLDACDTDATCRSQFAELKLSATDALKKMISRLETNPRLANTCMATIGSWAYDPARDLSPAHGIRRLFAVMRRHPKTVKLVPVIIYRLYRCSDYDEALLKTLWSQLKKTLEEGVPIAMDMSGPLVGFVENVVSYSELWPSPVPEWRELASEFESTPVGEGNMLLQQPSYCVYTGSTSEACKPLYTRRVTMDPSLVLSYPAPAPQKKANATNGLAGDNSADVLIFASRLSMSDSMDVANEIYDEFTRGAPANQTALLVESDSLLVTELLSDDAMSETKLKLLGLFVTKQLQGSSGKWFVNDLASMASGWSVAPSNSTFSTAPVQVNWTLTPDELKLWFPNDTQNIYGIDTGRSSSSNGGVRTWHWILIIAGVLLVVGILIFVIAKRRRRPEVKIALTPQSTDSESTFQQAV